MLITTTAKADRIEHVGPKCRSTVAPVLCAIKEQRHRTNTWRLRAGSKRLYLSSKVYVADRPRRLIMLDRWIARRDKAHAFYDALVSWYRSSGATCVHNGEGSWTDPNPKYYGGFQMDIPFQQSHGSRYLRKYGTANHWPVMVQVRVTRRVVLASGWGQWPQTARNCGLIGG